MNVFLDTEFTSFHQPTLISLALVTEDGCAFYAENADVPRADCSPFVCDVVLPLLGRVDGATAHLPEIAQRLHDWISALAQPITVVCDFEGDWQLLCGVLSSAVPVRAPWQPSHLKAGWPSNLERPLVLAERTTADPVFESASQRTFTRQWPPHHALADARALRAGWAAYAASMEAVWASQ